MAGGGGDKSSGSSHQIHEVKLPAWVDAASQANYARAQAVADRPFAQYGGKTVAELSPEFWTAQGKLGGLDDAYGSYDAAQKALAGLLGYNPSNVGGATVKAGQLKDTDLQPYLNPYIQNVESRAIDNATRAGRVAQNQLQTDAAKAKAFGGSRQAIQQAVQEAETTRGIGDLSAELRKAGYDSAQAAAMGDIQTRLQADTQSGAWSQEAALANQRAGLEAAGLRRGAATDIAGVADQAQRARMAEIAQFLGIGEMRQAQKQREYDADKAKWQEKRDYPLEQLQIVMSALGMSPYGRTETTDKTSTSESTVGGGAGGMMGGIMGMIPSLLGLFSDRTAKTDIERLGHDPVLDVPLYAYRYKKDPKTYPKVVGPMAQDIEKRHPGAVRKVAGKRVIDLTALVA